MLFVVCSLSLIECRLLFAFACAVVRYCLLFAVCCLLFAVRYLWLAVFVVCGLLIGVRFVVVDVCGWLFAVCHLLFVGCCYVC